MCRVAERCDGRYGAAVRGAAPAAGLNSPFAGEIGISQGRLSEIEQGKTKPSAETLKELRKRFQVDSNWLFDELDP
ncbi:helix-turn-helix domain-containing protein [Cohnella ginsengisoli]|uniref:Helix-turn-helix domain-containing protein n=1 Tax=Cohnella ginsengisoli TaxID=425004 RepID=A0A9X4KH45_9BACL|nr:helix-turn-helix transcriptional regulator [Cohnella ginsengisoli]MDG0791846.1 helix-turn-helix domain-containing protein [Cohnella ginsengisoli]